MKKILVVDDSPFMLKLIGDILTNLNYQVTTTESGQDACQRVAEDRFDLIITDLNMPNMDGLEFTRQVRTLPNCKFVPIVMLSSEEDNERISAARAMGISTFLSKPPREDQLRNILQIILNKRSAQRVAVELPVSFGAGFAESGNTLNLSAGGMFLAVDAPSSPGSKLALRFELPDNAGHIVCQARVAWVITAESPESANHPSGMGLEFIDLAETALLKQYINAV